MRRGDAPAFHGLVDRYFRELFGLAVSLGARSADAEDVVQETFAAAYTHATSFEERSSVKTWLVRILVRQVARLYRKRGGRHVVSLDDTPDRPAAGRATADADVRMDLAAALEHLPPEYREVVVLRELQGMSYDEISQALTIPRGTVESRLFRARRALRERMRAYLE